MSRKAPIPANKRFDSEIDLSGLNCPMPILKTKAALATMAQGAVLRIIVTNNDSVREIQNYVKQVGAELQQDSDGEGAFILYLRKR